MNRPIENWAPTVDSSITLIREGNSLTGPKLKGTLLIMERMDPSFRTDRLRLVPLGLAHLSGFHEMESDEAVTLHQDYSPRTLEQSTKYVQDSEESWALDSFPEWQEFAILLDGFFVGRIGFEHANEVATVWFALLPRCQGQGYATEALKAILAHGAESGLKSFEANCAVRNAPSAALLLRCGFQEIPAPEPDLRMFRQNLEAHPDIRV